MSGAGVQAREILAREGVEPEESRGRHAGTQGVSDGTDEEHFLAELATRYAPVNWVEAWKEHPADVDWLVEGFLERGTVNALFASPGTGKSLVTLELAVGIIRGGQTVVYIDDENRVCDLVERLQAFGCVPEELDRLRAYSFAGLPPLDTALGGTHLLALAVTAGAVLVVLDTTTRMVRGRENDSDTFLQLYRCSLVPLKARGVTVLRLDHPGKDAERGQRGSSAKDGDVDTIWQMTTVAAGREYRLERSKSRSGHGEPSYVLRRRFEPLRHEWTCPDGSPHDKLAGQLNALNVPLTAGRDAVRKILAANGIKASNQQISAAIKARKTCPGQVADGADSGNTGQLSAPHAPVGADSGQVPAPDCEFCGTPHVRYGKGGRPCRERDLTHHYRETRGVA